MLRMKEVALLMCCSFIDASYKSSNQAVVGFFIFFFFVRQCVRHYFKCRFKLFSHNMETTNMPHHWLCHFCSGNLNCTGDDFGLYHNVRDRKSDIEKKNQHPSGLNLTELHVDKVCLENKHTSSIRLLTFGSLQVVQHSFSSSVGRFNVVAYHRHFVPV